MYDVAAAWKTALQNEGTKQHIKGIIIDKNGNRIDIQDKIADNSVRIEKQCTADADSFAIGQIYTGTIEFTLLEASALRRDDLKGGTVSLQFGVVVGNDTDPTWIPLGVWNITDPQRGSQDSIIIKGEDNTSKLDVPIQDNTTGYIKFAAHMDIVTELTGIQFAQTIEELSTIAGIDLSLNMTHTSTFCATCRAELNAMAAYIGGIAYIDREGLIAFRKIGDNVGTATTELNIPAAKRFCVDLGEYSIRVAKAAMTFTARGNSTVTITDAAEGTAANTEFVVDITGNPYAQKLDESDRLDILDRIRDNLASAGVWVPGQIDYYGDPTIDLGDVLTLSGGVNGETTSQFLVTGIVWQFRGPQTLISAGAGTASATSTGSSSGSASSGGSQSVIIQQATIGAVNIDFYRDSFTTLIEIGEVMVAAANETVGIVQLTVQLQGTDDADNEIRILRDGIMQTTCSCDTIASAQKHTVSLTAVLDLSEGIHIISVEAKGSAAILRAVGTVYGQGLQEFTGNPTFDSDYMASGGVISAYNGDDDMPRIPAQLGGSDVETIGGGAFEDADIEYAYIPEGTEEIE